MDSCYLRLQIIQLAFCKAKGLLLVSEAGTEEWNNPPRSRVTLSLLFAWYKLLCAHLLSGYLRICLMPAATREVVEDTSFMCKHSSIITITLKSGRKPGLKPVLTHKSQMDQS
jgi:hypothetical protein